MKGLPSSKLMLDDSEAFRVAREPARVESLFVGILSGAAMWGAQQIARRIREGTIVVIFPDGGEKYMSTPLFELPVGSLFDKILQETMVSDLLRSQPIEKGARSKPFH